MKGAGARLVELLGPEILGRDQYWAKGVLAPSGCIYFAPISGGRVLCINAEGIVEMIGFELAGEGQYVAGGVVAPNGCIYFAPAYAGQVLCISE